MRPEEKIEKRFVKKVSEIGCRAEKFEIVGKKGAPDRLVLIPGGEIIFVEFKAPGGKLSYHQVEFHDMLRKFGFRVYTCETWEVPLGIVKTMMEQVREYSEIIR